jgi:predicted RNase H-like HicB family nuclease
MTKKPVKTTKASTRTVLKTNIEISEQEIAEMTPGLFTVKIQKDGSEYHAFCPELKGCHTHGKTKEEALENLREAVHLYIDTIFETSEFKSKNKFITVRL